MTTIDTYRYKGQIVFDDETKGLKAEALVGGVPQILQKICKTARKHYEFRIQFDTKPFGNCYVIQKSIDQPTVGTFYLFITGSGTIMKGWLCPNLGKYFKSPPERIYFTVVKL